jgi:hypothetical protein
MAAQEETPKVAPRIQAWLDRKAEGLVYAEKEKVAALSEKERAEELRMRAQELRMKIRSTAEYGAMARAHDKEEKQAAERESAARSKNSARPEATRRSHQPEKTKAQTAHGDAPGPRLSSRSVILHGPE